MSLWRRQPLDVFDRSCCRHNSKEAVLALCPVSQTRCKCMVLTSDRPREDRRTQVPVISSYSERPSDRCDHGGRCKQKQKPRETLAPPGHREGPTRICRAYRRKQCFFPFHHKRPYMLGIMVCGPKICRRRSIRRGGKRKCAHRLRARCATKRVCRHPQHLLVVRNGFIVAVWSRPTQKARPMMTPTSNAPAIAPGHCAAPSLQVHRPVSWRPPLPWRQAPPPHLPLRRQRCLFVGPPHTALVKAAQR
jgi:hypothetical protein